MCICSTAACADPGRVFSIADYAAFKNVYTSAACAAHGSFESNLQQTVLPASVLKHPVLPLDVLFCRSLCFPVSMGASVCRFNHQPVLCFCCTWTCLSSKAYLGTFMYLSRRNFVLHLDVFDYKSLCCTCRKTVMSCKGL